MEIFASRTAGVSVLVTIETIMMRDIRGMRCCGFVPLGKLSRLVEKATTGMMTCAAFDIVALNVEELFKYGVQRRI